MKENDEYRDILYLPHYRSVRHAPLSRPQRAAQFMPFAALTGFDEEIAEEGRETIEARELSEENMNALDSALSEYLTFHTSGHENARVRIVYFEPDASKDGGEYQIFEGRIEKVDEYERCLICEGGLRIPAYHVIDIAQCDS